MKLIIPAVLLCISVYAQWINYRQPDMPRLKDGKVNLSAPVPRTADRKPDLTGVWMHEPTPTAELRRIVCAAGPNCELDNLPPGMNAELQNKYGIDILIDFDADWLSSLSALKPGAPLPTEPLMQPEAFASLLRRAAERQFPDINRCNTDFGWPLAGMVSEPIKIVQSMKETMILYEVGNMHRQIFTDGRGFPEEFELPAYLGYSVGHWEGDMFVVETRGFSDRTPLDGAGHPRSDAMRVVERFHRPDFGHLNVEMTFDDPKSYTQPFTIRVTHDLVPDNDIFEMFCENEKDAAHINR
jgi:hypothetical protein